MATETNQNSQTQGAQQGQATAQGNQAAAGLANNGQPLQQPAAGQVINVVVDPGQQVAFAFDPAAAEVSREGDDVVLAFEDGGKIVLQGFAVAAESDTPPQIILPDGSIIAGDVIVAQLDAGGTDLETAAGTGAPGGGGSSYSDDQGDAILGLNAEGPVDPTPFPRSAPEPEEQAELVEEDDAPDILVTPPELVPQTPGFDPDPDGDGRTPEGLPIELDGARGIVDEAALPDGSGGGTTQASGTIEFDTGDDELQALEIQGTDGVWVDITNGGVVVGEYGTLVINPDYTWTYTLNDSTLDHTDTSTEDGDSDRGIFDTVLDGWTVRVTDDDGDQASDTLTVAVTDDGPIAVDDATNTAFNTPVTYDVMANDKEGADASILQSAEMAAGFEADGSVAIDADTGEVTFTPTEGFSGSTVIDYTIVDTEGDVSSATLTVTITTSPPPPNLSPTADPGSAVVSEEGFEEISNPDSTPVPDDDTNATTAFGSINAADPEGGALTVTLSTAGLPATWESGGQLISWEGDGTSTVTGVVGEGDPVISITIDEFGSYTVQLHAKIDHPINDIEDELNFDITANVSDGVNPAVPAVISVQIEDDRPIVDIDPFGDGSDDVIEGNTITGSWSYDYGADEVTGEDAIDASIVITIDGMTGESWGVGDDITVNMGGDGDEDLGVLTINDDDTWTFASADNLDNTDTTGPNFTFNVHVTDSDGDTVSDSHDVTILDGREPSDAQPVALVVDDDALDGDGLPEHAPSDDDEILSATMSFVEGAHPFVANGYEFLAIADYTTSIVVKDASNLDIAMSWQVDGGVLKGTADSGTGEVWLTLSNGQTDGDVTVAAEIKDNFLHDTTDGNTESDITISGLIVTAVDTDGDTAEGIVNVTVDDDIPYLSIVEVDGGNDTIDTVEEGDPTITGSWSYDYGADEVTGEDAIDASIVITIDGITGESWGVGDAITVNMGGDGDEDLGVLTINDDDTWTFASADNLDNDQTALDFTFNISVTDADNDTFTDSHKVVITDGSGPSDAQPVALVVDDDALDGDGLPEHAPSDDDEILSATMSFVEGAHPFVANGYEFLAIADYTTSIVVKDASNLDIAMSWQVDGGVLKGTADSGTGEVWLTLSNGQTDGDVTVAAEIKDNFLHDTTDGNTESDITISGLIVTAVDTDGDTAEGIVNVTVDDDIPYLSIVEVDGGNDTIDTVEEGDPTITGSWSYDYGADEVTGEDAIDASIVITIDGMTGQSWGVGDAITVNMGGDGDEDLGVLTINDDDTWTFASADNLDNDQTALDFTFNIGVTDADNDTFTDSHKVVITDGSGPSDAQPIALVVDDDALDGDGLPAGTGDDDEDLTGDLQFVEGAHKFVADGYSFDLTENGNPTVVNDNGDTVAMNWNNEGNILKGTAVSGPGEIWLTLSAGDADGKVTVTAEIKDNFLHWDGDSDTESDIDITGITVEATDTDGDNAYGIVNVSVDDDVPHLSIVEVDGGNDTIDTVEEGDPTITGSWSYDYGADEVTGEDAIDASIVITIDGMTGQSWGVGDAITVNMGGDGDEDLGVLTINDDDTWTFASADNLDNDQTALDFTFNISVTDADNDTFTDSHKVVITDGSGPSDAQPIALVVDDDALDGDGLPAGTGDDDEDLTGDLQFVEGAHKFVADGYSFDLTENGNPTVVNDNGDTVAMNWNNEGNILKGTAVSGPGEIWLTLSAGDADGKVTVTAEIKDNFLHWDGDSDTESDIDITGITVEATDTDGDNAYGIVNVSVDDDVPHLSIVEVDGGNDTIDTVEEGDPTITGSWSYDYGADEVTGEDAIDASIVITIDGMTGQSWGVGDAITVNMGGDGDEDLGVLTINDDDTWTFASADNLDNDQTALDFTFNIGVTDADNDTFTDSHKVVITDGSGPSDAQPIALVVDDDALDGDGLPAGTGDDDEDLTGDLQFVEGAHKFVADGYSFDLTENGNPTVVNDNGDTVAMNWNNEGNILKGTAVSGPGEIWLTLSAGDADGKVTVTAEIKDNFLHWDGDSDTESDIDITGITVEATDTDGDNAYGIVNVSVDDDVPHLSIVEVDGGNDTIDTVEEGDPTITGSWSYDYGADEVTGEDAIDASIVITIDGMTGQSWGVGDAITVNMGGDGDEDLGVLTINDDDTWTFASADNLDNDQTALDFTFNIGVTDADNDTFTDSHKVVITDGSGPSDAQPIALVVDDDALDGDGLPAGTGDDDEDLTGDLQFVEGAHKFVADGYSFDLTENGNPTVVNDNGDTVAMNWNNEGNILKGTAVSGPGEIWLTLSAGDADGKVTVTAEIKDNFLHWDGDSDTESDIDITGITVEATDTDGDNAYGIVNVSVDDDVPHLSIVEVDGGNDTIDTVEEGDPTITGSWSYDYGADEVTGEDAIDASIVITIDGMTGQSWGVGDAITVNMGGDGDEDLGVLTINDDDTWTFASADNLDNDQTALDFTFNIGVTDADNDTFTDSHKVVITDGSEPSGPGLTTLTVDEDDIIGAGGNPGGTGDLTTPDGSESIVFTKGEAAHNFTSIVFDTSGGNPTVLDAENNPIDMNWTNEGNILKGIADSGQGEIWLTLTGTVATGNMTITADLKEPFDHGDDSNVEGDINITGISVLATDTDNDTATGSVSVVIDDDTPELDWIQDGIIANDPDGTFPSETLIGQHNLSIGADALSDGVGDNPDGLVLSISDITLASSSGDTVFTDIGGGITEVVIPRSIDGVDSTITFYYKESDFDNVEGSATIQAYSDAETTKEFFTISFKDDGTYEFTIDNELEALKTITLGNSAGTTGGNNDVFYIPDEPGVEIAITGSTDFTVTEGAGEDPDTVDGGTPDTVNTSDVGLGVDGQNFGVDEALFFEFTEDQTVVSMGVTGWSGTSAFQVDWYTYASEDDYLNDLGTGFDPDSTPGVLDNAIDEAFDVPLTPGDDTRFFTVESDDFGYLVVVGAGGTAGGAPKVKIAELTYGAVEVLDDMIINLDVTATDSDGDTVSDSFTVTMDADETPDTDGHLIVGGPGDEVILGSDGDDVISGGGGNDVIDGGAGNDDISGGADNDLIVGGAGNDEIDGGLGEDIISGGIGDDLIIGGAGNDDLTGGGGNDTFDYGAEVVSGTAINGDDVIQDLTIGEDEIDIVDALSALAPAEDPDPTGSVEDASLGTATVDINEENTDVTADITVVDVDLNLLNGIITPEADT